MNILILSKSLHRGGIETHILTLAKKLKDNGHTVLVASDLLKEKARFEQIGVHVYEIAFLSHSPIQMAKNLSNLKSLIRKHDIDIVHCQWRICSVYMESINKFGRLKTPYVWSNHIFLKPSWINKLFTFYGGKVIVSSKDCLKSMVSDYHLPEADVELVYNGIDFENYNNQNENIIRLKEKLQLSYEFIITMLCRFEAIKNHKCTIEALNILVNQRGCKNLKCIIVGEGEKKYVEEIKNLVKNYKLEDIVIFAGFTEAISTLGFTNVMVLPSQAEGFPISVLEAFAMKVPVIRTRTGGYTDVKDYCLDIDFNDAVGLANQIDYVKENSSGIQKMIENAYEFVKNTCTSDIMLKKILKIYQEVINKEINGGGSYE